MRKRILVAVAVGQVLLSAAMGLLLMTLFSFRFTYVRPVAFANDTGQDPYALARAGVDRLSRDLFMPGMALAIAGAVLGTLVIVDCFRRRALESREPPRVP